MINLAIRPEHTLLEPPLEEQLHEVKLPRRFALEYLEKQLAVQSLFEVIERHKLLGEVAMAFYRKLVQHGLEE